VVCWASCLLVRFAQAQQRATVSHAAAVAKLSKQLLWHDEATQKQYLAVRDQVTQQTLHEIDSFISDSYQPATATADAVKAGLDGLLGYKSRDALKNVSFLVNLPGGRFLITGIELRRGGGNFAEDAISFRAYGQSGGKFVLVAHIEDFHSSDAGNPFVYSFYCEPLPAPPVIGEFWFLALAAANIQAPPMIAMRLYAFDGEKFRAVWSPQDIMCEGPKSAVRFTSSGFVVNTLFDPTGMAPHSPTVAVHTQYTLSSDGPHEVAKWKN
jgi:hypothetical protein